LSFDLSPEKIKELMVFVNQQLETL
jgi:hypothetical protein